MIGITDKNYVVSIVVIDKVARIQLHKPEDEIIPGMLTKKLIRRSSGFGLNISKPLLEILDIDPESDMLDIDISNNTLIIKNSL